MTNYLELVKPVCDLITTVLILWMVYSLSVRVAKLERK